MPTPAVEHDPLAEIRDQIGRSRDEWPAEQARRLAAVLGEAGASADDVGRLPELAWRQAIAVVNDRVREAGGPKPYGVSPMPDDDVRRRVIFKLAEWFGEDG